MCVYVCVCVYIYIYIYREREREREGERERIFLSGCEGPETLDNWPPPYTPTLLKIFIFKIPKKPPPKHDLKETENHRCNKYVSGSGFDPHS